MKVLIALAFSMLVSCAAFPTPRRSLAGEWRYADSTQSCYYDFGVNGTFRGNVTYQHKLLSKFTGRWSLTGNTLNYKYTRDVLGRIAPGTLDHDKLLSVRRDFFVIEAADGSKRKYFRVRE